jgi:hypothetical protein
MGNELGVSVSESVVLMALNRLYSEKLLEPVNQFAKICFALSPTIAPLTMTNFRPQTAVRHRFLNANFPFQFKTGF